MLDCEQSPGTSARKGSITSKRHDSCTQQPPQPDSPQGMPTAIGCDMLMVMTTGTDTSHDGYAQVVNRDKLQRAGEDNLFVRLLYAKDKPQKPENQDEQEKLGKPLPQAVVCC